MPVRARTGLFAPSAPRVTAGTAMTGRPASSKERAPLRQGTCWMGAWSRAGTLTRCVMQYVCCCECAVTGGERRGAAQGDRQWLELDLPAPCVLERIVVQFQGGFSAQVRGNSPLWARGGGVVDWARRTSWWRPGTWAARCRRWTASTRSTATQSRYAACALADSAPTSAPAPSRVGMTRLPSRLSLQHAFELDEPVRCQRVRLVFGKLVDFYGRVTIYKVDLQGQP